MKFLVKKDDLLKALQLIQISSPKTILPILSNVLIEVIENSLVLIGTDLEISIKCNIDVEVIEQGSIVLPAKKLVDIVRELPEDDVKIEKDEDMKVVIESGKVIFHLFGLHKEEFPTFPDVNLDLSFSFNSNLMREMFRKTAFASAVDDVRYVLNGVYWVIDSNGCKMVATDGHRLAFINKQLDIDISPINVIVPTKTLYEINRVIKEDEDIQLVITQDKIIVFNNKKVLVSKLIEGKFPDYKKVIPEKQDNIFIVNTKELLSACHRVSLVTAEKNYTVKFFISKERLTLTSNTPNLGEAKEDIGIVYDGQDIEIALNYKYIMDILKNIDTEDLSISFQTANEAVAIRPAKKHEVETHLETDTDIEISDISALSEDEKGIAFEPQDTNIVTEIGSGFTEEEYVCIVMPMRF